MNHNPWLKNLFRPLVIGVMCGCIALSLVGLVPADPRQGAAWR